MMFSGRWKTMMINDFPKIESPFVRKINEKRRCD